MSTYWVDVVVTLTLCLLAFTGWLRAHHWRRLYLHATRPTAGVLEIRAAPPTWRTPLRRLRHQRMTRRLTALITTARTGPPTIVYLPDDAPDPDRTEPPA